MVELYFINGYWKYTSGELQEDSLYLKKSPFFLQFTFGVSFSVQTQNDASST
jgi:hypothetical protein